MMGRMDDLVHFLRDRYDEEATEAQAAEKRTTTTRRWIQGEWVEDTVQPPEWRRSVWSPARVLREIEAKRRTVDLHGIVHRNIGWRDADGETEYAEIPVCGLCVPKHTHYLTRQLVAEGPCTTVRLLALPYADHPDYQETWKP